MDGDTQEISEPLKHEEMSETTDSAEVSTRPVPPPRRHRSGVNEPDMNTTASTTPLIESSSPEKPSPLAEDLNSPKAQRLHQHHDENFDDFEDDCIPGVVYKPTTLGSQGQFLNDLLNYWDQFRSLRINLIFFA